MKLSWGVGITLSIIGFLVVSVGTIIFSFSEDVNLVRDDYYEQEIVYQQQINKIKRTEALSEQLEIKVINSTISLNFPSMFNSESISGIITLYRPSDRKDDLMIPISVDTTNTLLLTTKTMSKGLWRVKVDWIADNNTYYNEKIIMVQ